MRACMYVCMYECVYVCVCMYVCMYMYADLFYVADAPGSVVLVRSWSAARCPEAFKVTRVLFLTRRTLVVVFLSFVSPASFFLFRDLRLLLCCFLFRASVPFFLRCVYTRVAVRERIDYLFCLFFFSFFGTRPCTPPEVVELLLL